MQTRRAIARVLGIGKAVALGVLCVALAPAVSHAAAEDTAVSGKSVLRVCADPNNMPFSNEKGEGFENKLAELVAHKLDSQLEYSWFSESAGYVPPTMGGDACDLVMGYAQGTGLIEDTNPYYYTSYVLLYRDDDASLKGVAGISDPRLKGKSIGYFARTLPASILAMHGLVTTAKPFDLRSYDNASKAAVAMIDDIAAGRLDAGVLWGPLGGYYAQRAGVALKLVPLVKETVGPRTIYGITMGVRPDDPPWKHKVNKVIADNQDAIIVILQSYNVPVLDNRGNLITAATAER